MEALTGRKAEQAQDGKGGENRQQLGCVAEEQSDGKWVKGGKTGGNLHALLKEQRDGK